MGATYSISPTYYQVTVDFTTPTSYTGLPGTQAGTVDAVAAADYNRRVAVTGNVNVAVSGVITGNSIIINNQPITFATTSSPQAITDTINFYRKDTGVMASQGIAANYITLSNTPGAPGAPFTIADGTTPVLSKLGLTAGTYQWGVSTYGASFTAVANNDNISINGTTVVFTTAGGLTVPGVVATLNAASATTGVQALIAAGNVQLNGIDGVPYVIGAGGAAVSKLGFTAGSYGGSPSTLLQSTNKEQANMRWQLIINGLEWSINPLVIGDFQGFGNFDGTSELTSIEFTVGFERADQIYTIELPGEPNPGNTLVAEEAIRRAVARGLTNTYNTNRKLFDPTLNNFTMGTAASRPNPFRITNMTVTGIDTLADIMTVESNISVVRVNNI